jgi:hypothetical protein
VFKHSKRIEKKRRITIRKKLLIAIVILCVGAVGYGVHALTSTVHGHEIPVNVKLLPQQQSTPDSTVPAATTSGGVLNSYFSLTLPAGFSVQAGNQTAPGLLYNQTLVQTSLDGTLLVSISVKDLPAGGLTADSSYQLRSQQPAQYVLSNKTINGESVTIAAASQSDGVVAFWPHASYLATISATTGLNNADASNVPQEEAALLSLLNSWQWK